MIARIRRWLQLRRQDRHLYAQIRARRTLATITRPCPKSGMRLIDHVHPILCVCGALVRPFYDHDRGEWVVESHPAPVEVA